MGSPVPVVRHATAAPTAHLVDRSGRRHELGTIVSWWTADLVVHAYRLPYPATGPETRCGWPAGRRTIPLGYALAIARPCRVCWRPVPVQLALEDPTP